MRIQFALPAVIVIPLAICGIAPAAAAEMPARKPGLWEIKMSMAGRDLPVQTMTSCIDAETDRMMNTMGGGMTQEVCAKQEVRQEGDTLIVDSECEVAGGKTVSRGVITGSFDSAYTLKVTSRRESGPALPGMPVGAETQMTIEAKWLGACKSGQRPGDVVMANGMKINIRDMQKFMPGAPRPR